MADVELVGMEEVLNNLERKLGSSRVKMVVNKSLRQVGKEAEEDLKSAVSVFARTGGTVEQTTHSNVSWADYGIPTVKIGWRSGSRWRLEHLQEFGFSRYGRAVSPRGRGVLRKYVDRYEAEYPKKIQEGLKELVD